MITSANIKQHGGVPLIESGENIASIIDHGIGDYEIVFEKPIPEDFRLMFTGFDAPMFIDNPHPDRMGANAKVPSIRIYVRSSLSLEPVDGDFNLVVIHG